MATPPNGKVLDLLGRLVCCWLAVVSFAPPEKGHLLPSPYPSRVCFD